MMSDPCGSILSPTTKGKTMNLDEFRAHILAEREAQAKQTAQAMREIAKAGK